jgi:hypothetical protein
MSGRRARDARAVATVDQARAAAQHAERTMRRLAAQSPGVDLERGTLPLADHAAARAILAVRAGRAVLCRHLRPDRPSVLHVFAHAPESVRCVPCAERHARIVRGTVEDRTCDGCGEVDPVGVYAGVMSAGPLLVTFGLCGDCREAQWLRRSA